MGYTHYWSYSRDFHPAEWARFLAGAERVIRHAREVEGIALAGALGDNLPSWDGDELALNGAKPADYETFNLSRTAIDRWTFCKTGRRPYDAVVVALLVLAERIGPLTWSSDGDDDDHHAGRVLLAAALEPAQWERWLGDGAVEPPRPAGAWVDGELEGSREVQP